MESVVETENCIQQFQMWKHAVKPGFIWSDNRVEFAASGGTLIRAILFRAMIDSLSDDDSDVRNEAREWLHNNFKPFWNLIYGTGVDRMWQHMLSLWSGDAEMTMAEARTAISYSSNTITIVDPEGESRFGPIKYRRRRRAKSLHKG